MLRAIPSVTALLFASVALAAPRSIDDCELIKEPDAYNRCLAAFGPVRGGHGGRYYGPANEEKHGARRPMAASTRPEPSCNARAQGECTWNSRPVRGDDACAPSVISSR